MTITKAAVQLAEAIRVWLVDPMLTQQKHTEALMSELDDSVNTIQTGLTGLKDQLTDFKGDFDAAIAKLQSGTDNTAAIAKLKAMSGQLTAMSDSIKTLDTTAEGLSGTATPPVA